MRILPKNNEYWADRFSTIENNVNKMSEVAYQNEVSTIVKAQKELDNKIEKWIYRLAKNNELDIVEARKLLTSNELKEFRWTLDEYIKYGEENAINPKWIKELENASAKVHITRLEALKLDTQKRLEQLAFEQTKSTTALAKNVYEESYFKGAYEIAKGTNKGLMLSGIDDDKLNKVATSVLAGDGRHFSERIWTDTSKMTNELHQELMKNVMLGKSPDESVKAMAKFVDGKIENKKSSAKRLLYTEASFYSSAGQKDMFEDLGVEWYEVVATLDSKTSSVCKELDGKVFPISEFKAGMTAPPFHVRCRSTTVPNFDKEDEELGLKGELSEGQRVARGEDGKSYFVPSDMGYEEWYNEYVDKVDIVTLESAKNWESLDKYISETYNISIADDVKKLNFATVKKSLTGIDTMFKEFPEISESVKKMLISEKGIMSCSGKNIFFNSKYYQDSKKLFKTCNDMSEISFWVKNSSPESIGVHEAAHGLEWVLLNLNPKYSSHSKLIAAWNDCTEASKIVSSACKNIKKTPFGKSKTNKALIEAISHYANDSPSETMAEAFADIYANKDNANPLSIEIKQVTTQILEKYRKGDFDESKGTLGRLFNRGKK